MPKITKRSVDAIQPIPHKIVKLWDSELKGFGVFVYPTGRRSYCIQYRNKDRVQKTNKVGIHGVITTEEARTIAKQKLGDVAQGGDPAAHKTTQSRLFTQLIEQYINRHLPRKSQKSQSEDNGMIERVLRPAFQDKLLSQMNFDVIQSLHLQLKEEPYKANRVLALLSKMFSLAISWEWVGSNPVLGIERYPEEKRNRWLDEKELSRLWRTLDQYPANYTACLFKFLILTGVRKGEALHAQWDHFDLNKGVWTKPSHLTKQKKMEHLPLSDKTVSFLTTLKNRAPKDNTYLFPGKIPRHPLKEVKKFWATVVKKADLESVRIHDLRHTHASHLVSSGLSLSIVGKMLGHTQIATTQRYAHLADAPLREATNLFSKKLDRATETEDYKKE